MKEHCNTCLSKNTDLSLLPDHLKHLLQKCTSINLITDEFSVCNVCSEKLNDWWEFIENIQRINEVNTNSSDLGDCHESTDDENLTTRKQQTKIPCYPCAYCPSILTTKNNLLHHTSNQHFEQRPIICEHCTSRSFSGLGALKRHAAHAHSNVARKQCQQCPLTFAFTAELELHERTEHARAKCPVCGVHVDSAVAIRPHLLTHGPALKKFSQVKPVFDRAFACSSCAKTFDNARSLDRHVRKLHVKLTFKCQKCPKIFERSVELDSHMTGQHVDVVRDVTCAEITKLDCDGSFYTHDQLYEHFVAEHLTRVGRACIFCHQTRVKMKQHYKIHLLPNAFACTQCPRTYKTRDSLRVHVLKHANAWKRMCNVCGLSFTNLNDHVRNRHSGKRAKTTRKCRYCAQVFASTARVIAHHKVAHVRERTARLTVTCAVCAKKFPALSNMYHHVRAAHRDVKHGAVTPLERGCHTGLKTRGKVDLCGDLGEGYDHS